MKKNINNFSEFKRVIVRNLSRGYDVYFTRYGFYYRTSKCDFFYSCRSVVDRMRVFSFLRENQIKHYELESFV